MKRLARIYNVIALIGFNTLVLAVALELAARLVVFGILPEDRLLRFKLPEEWPTEKLRYSPHPYLTYYPSPNYRNNTTRHNSLGYRADEIAMPKPPGVYRIVTMGGSTTYTEGVEDNALTYPAVMERELRDTHGLGNVEVINAGIGGHASFETMINFETRVLDLEPDMVVIYHGTNDTHARFVPPKLYRGDNTGRRKHWSDPDLSWWERNFLLVRLFKRMNLKAPPAPNDFTSPPTAFTFTDDPMAVLDANPPIYFERNLANIIAIAKDRGIDVVLATWASASFNPNHYSGKDYYHRGFEEARQVVLQLGERYGVPVYKFHEDMPKDRPLWTDGIHVTEAGAKIKGELFAKFIAGTGLIPKTGD